VERAERLILALVGAGLEGLGVPQALRVALWLLAVGSVITLAQRLVAVWRSARAQISPRPGTGVLDPGVHDPGLPDTVEEATDGDAEAGATDGVDGR
jgi:CDP-diacylglycerol--glycerol-3-phosphate 3-phosphatidyltransferase